MADPTGMGPEALLVRARFDPRVVLAEYALEDCTREAARTVEEMLRRELAALPVRRTLAQRLRGWGRQRLARTSVPLAAAPALCRGAAEGPVGGEPADPAYAEVTLAAMPALRGGTRPAGAGALVGAAPAYARD